MISKTSLAVDDMIRTNLVGKLTVLPSTVAVPPTLNKPKAGALVQLTGMSLIVCGNIALSVLSVNLVPPKISLIVTWMLEK